MAPKNLYMFLIIAVFLVTVGIWAYNYAELRAQYDKATVEYERAMLSVYGNYSQMEKEYSRLKVQYDGVLQSLGNLSTRQSAIQSSNQELLAEIGDLKAENKQLQISYNAKDVECGQFRNTLSKCMASSAQNYQKIKELESNVLFKGGNATVNFYLNDGTSHYLVYDIGVLNYYLNEGYLNRRIIDLYRDGYPASNLSIYFEKFRVDRFMYGGVPQPTITIQATDGTTVQVKNYIAFKDTRGVLSLANYIKSNSATNTDFIKNVILVKSQLNDYTYGIRGEPRYPVETFLEGGGDCGASSLLVGSMIKAAHPEWTVQMWLVDADPTSPPKDFSHFIVYVDNGPGLRMFIETTEKDPDRALSIYEGKEIYGQSFDF